MGSGASYEASKKADMKAAKKAYIEQQMEIRDEERKRKRNVALMRAAAHKQENVGVKTPSSSRVNSESGFGIPRVGSNYSTLSSMSALGYELQERMDNKDCESVWFMDRRRRRNKAFIAAGAYGMGLDIARQEGGGFSISSSEGGVSRCPSDFTTLSELAKA